MRDTGVQFDPMATPVAYAIPLLIVSSFMVPELLDVYSARDGRMLHSRLRMVMPVERWRLESDTLILP